MTNPPLDLATASILLLRAYVTGGEQKEDHVGYTILDLGSVDAGGMRVGIIPGSDELEDWFDDFKAWKSRATINGQHYKIHAGFLEQANLVADVLKDCDVFIGHSMGGAVAQICALRAKKPVITFGAPRVGNRAFARAIAPYHQRVKGRGDIVTHVPPWWFGYKHGGTVIRVGKKDAPWWKFLSLRDHIMADYVQVNYQVFEGIEPGNLDL